MLCYTQVIYMRHDTVNSVSCRVGNRGEVKGEEGESAPEVVVDSLGRLAAGRGVRCVAAEGTSLVPIPCSRRHHHVCLFTYTGGLYSDTAHSVHEHFMSG